jgi:bacterioferritin-associated ferredoxin
MIICSCNVISDKQVFSVLAAQLRLPPISQVYAGLGCRHDAVGVFRPSRSSVMKHSPPSGRRGSRGHKKVCPRCGSAFT